MKYLKIFVALLIPALLIQMLIAQSGSQQPKVKNPYYSHTDNTPVKMSDAEWKKILSPDVYYIAREKGTEVPYTGKYWDNHKSGIYYCAACGHPLYSSDAKFESHTGWPSFFQPLNANSVSIVTDPDGDRNEVLCKRCGAHLGHVFDDGPNPTGKRYCMDGNVLDFEAKAP